MATRFIDNGTIGRQVAFPSKGGVLKARLRDLSAGIGRLPAGLSNAITDVPGVLVGHATVIRDEPKVIRSGITIVVPRDGGIWTDYAYAASHVLNGNGEMTGLAWVEESGMLGSPIGITNTYQVGLVRDFLAAESVRVGVTEDFLLPVVGETDDGWLSDAEAFALTEEDAAAALSAASGGPVVEGCVGGGTGMICHEFKGGIGTSSRVVEIDGETYVVGALVQANYGAREDFRIDGVPVGAVIDSEQVASPWDEPANGGSIIVIIATDAPLLPGQCRRLAQRATIGVGRVGGYGHNSSGDLFFAFATGNHLEERPGKLRTVATVPNESMDPLFHAVVESTEESIVNALFAAETTTGRFDRIAHALPLDRVAPILERYRVGLA
jgi:D-aminopeptidase